MKLSADLPSFLHGTGDRYHRAKTYVAWRCEPDLVGVADWGQYDKTSFAERALVIDHFVLNARAPQRLLVDSQYCTDAGPHVFASAADFWLSRRIRHATSVSRLAVVIPHGFVGVVITGMSTLLDLGCPLRLFQELAPALTWLGVVEPSVFAKQLPEVHPPVSHAALLCTLHELLVVRDFTISVAHAARQLGMSERTLQRRLSEADTTFQAELLRAKLTKAKALMLANTHSMTAIALELGFASLQHFSARFAAVNGESPSSWRRQQDRHAASKGFRVLAR